MQERDKIHIDFVCSEFIYIKKKMKENKEEACTTF